MKRDTTKVNTRCAMQIPNTPIAVPYVGFAFPREAEVRGVARGKKRRYNNRLHVTVSLYNEGGASLTYITVKQAHCTPI